MNLTKIKPKMGADYSDNHNTFLFNDPVFENYVTHYIEKT
jgi:hypothetical protein